jgi:integrase
MKSADKEKRGKAKPGSLVREGFIEDALYRKILESLPDALKPIFVVAYHLPLQKQELLSLRRDQVDLPKKRLFLNRQATKSDESKTAPIYGDMSAWLDILLTKCQTISTDGKYLFTNDRGNRIAQFRKPWNNACQLAGISGLLFRDLRRTATRNMVRSGFPAKLVMEVAGLKTASLLWRCTTTDKDDIVAAGRLLQRYFDQQRELKPKWPTGVKPN